MELLLNIVHVIISVILVAIILVQAGKGASVGAMFGGGGAQTLFGGRGPATFFQKFTTVMALLFLTTSVGLARIAKEDRSESVIGTVPPAAESVPAPTDAAPAPTPEPAAPQEAAPEPAGE